MNDFDRFYDEMIACLREVGARISTAQAKKSKAAIHLCMGGKTFYIRRHPKFPRVDAATGELKLSQREMAKSAGISERHLRRIQNGK